MGLLCVHSTGERFRATMALLSLDVCCVLSTIASNYNSSLTTGCGHLLSTIASNYNFLTTGCDHWMSVICCQQLLQITTTLTTGCILMKFGRSDPYTVIFTNCSNGYSCQMC